MIHNSGKTDPSLRTKGAVLGCNRRHSTAPHRLFSTTCKRSLRYEARSSMAVVTDLWDAWPDRAHSD